MVWVAALCLAASGAALADAKPAYDPVLMGPPPGPCLVAADSPTYVAGVDVNGYPVDPADILGGSTSILGSDKVTAEIRGHRRGGAPVLVDIEVPGLADLMNPPPACNPKDPHKAPASR